MGGNVFRGNTEPIKRENITPTLDRYFQELVRIFPSRTNIFFVPLGSTGKKEVSGDIDLGISEDLFYLMGDWDFNGLQRVRIAQDFQDMKRRARSSSDSQIKIKAVLKGIARKINEESDLIHVDESKVTTGNLFSMFPQYTQSGACLDIAVQIDWMVGNLKWLEFSYYSDAYDRGSNVKGLHRTQLILSAFQHVSLSFNHVSGVKDKETGEVVATTPDSSLEILSKRLGLKLNDYLEISRVTNYYTLHNHLKALLRPEDYNSIIDIYFKILDSTRADIPDNLQLEWKSRKTRLGLTGKFLPENSLLRE